MSFDDITAGRDLPNEINVIIEIPLDSEPVKYEVDKDTGTIFVDRIMKTAMRYPCNYGYIPHTLSDDGDPTDVLVILPMALIPGSVIPCRPVGLLKMEDEAGGDDKVLAVPVEKITGLYRNVNDIDDVEKMTLDQIAHFFDHYKDLETGKFVNVKGWFGLDEARKEILTSFERLKNKNA